MNRRKQQIKKDCENLAKEAAEIVGASAWYEQATHVLTENEKSAVNDLWDTMPGSSCWNDAFLKWMNQEPKPAYYGNNGTQEFWETEGDGFILMRLLRQDRWTAHQKRGAAILYYGGFYQTPEEAADYCNVTLDKSKVWKKHGQGFRMAQS